MRLCCVAVNAGIDKTYLVPGFRAGGSYRVNAVVAVAGGKALNAAKTARLLGVPHVVCTGFAAGRTGRWIRDDLAARGIAEAFVEVPGESREDVLILDPAAGAETRVLEAGMPVDEAAVEALTGRVGELAANSDLVVVAGSLPPGAAPDLYARLVGEARRAGARVFVDADGEALARAVAAGPDLVVPNEDEFAALAGRRAEDVAELVRLARGVRGPGGIAITLGPRGAVWIGGDAAWYAAAPAVAALGTVGSGDAFLGGVAAAVLHGEPEREALALGVAAGTANTLSPGPGLVDPATVATLRRRVVVTPVEVKAERRPV